jgi:uncharacterized protein with FMN-binding domain
MKKQGSGPSKKIGNNLVALSSAAILTVYAAGYLRTRSAADRFTVPAAQRRSAGPAQSDAVAPSPSAARDSGAPSTRTARSPQRLTIAPQGSTTSRPPVQTAAQTSAETSTEPPAQTAAQTAAQANAAPVFSAPSAAPAPLVAQVPLLPLAPLANDAPVAQGVHPPADAPASQTPAAEVHYKDGTFSGWGYCRHGDIQATVVVENGKLVAAGITQCLTRYPCSWIEKLPAQVVTRQSADVDYVSGATESADAFSDAVVDALTKAR